MAALYSYHADMRRAIRQWIQYVKDARVAGDLNTSFSTLKLGVSPFGLACGRISPWCLGYGIFLLVLQL